MSKLISLLMVYFCESKKRRGCNVVTMRIEYLFLCFDHSCSFLIRWDDISLSSTLNTWFIRGDWAADMFSVMFRLLFRFKRLLAAGKQIGNVRKEWRNGISGSKREANVVCWFRAFYIFPAIYAFSMIQCCLIF